VFLVEKRSAVFLRALALQKRCRDRSPSRVSLEDRHVDPLLPLLHHRLLLSHHQSMPEKCGATGGCCILVPSPVINRPLQNAFSRSSSRMAACITYVFSSLPATGILWKHSDSQTCLERIAYSNLSVQGYGISRAWISFYFVQVQTFLLCSAV
jgi:hypothetical protein